MNEMTRGTLIACAVVVAVSSADRAWGESKNRAAVTVYGADWCAPCHVVQDFLQQNHIPFEYRNVEIDAHQQAYARIRGSFSGIPLTMVGKMQIRGSNLRLLTVALRRGGWDVPVVAGDKGEKRYGGHTAKWWQQQIRSLRRQIVVVRAQQVQKGVEVLNKREEYQRLREALAQLEHDARASGVPIH